MSETLWLPPQPTTHINGQEFYAQGIENFDHVLTAEHEAKLGAMATAVSGYNMLLLGPPGGGKTMALRYFPEFFYDVDPNNVQHIPPQSDLSPQQVTGGRVTSSTLIDGPEGKRSETKIHEIDPILKPETQIIVGDELNRSSVYAVGALLEALESGNVTAVDGIRKLGRLLFAMSAVNPSGFDRTVFPMAPALVSRHPIGVSMGTTEADRGAIIGAALQRRLATPEKVQPFITTANLLDLRAQSETKRVAEKDMNTAGNIIYYANSVLREVGIHEGDGRMAKQIIDVASALAILGGHAAIEVGDVMQAAKFGVTSRVGALETKSQPNELLKVVVRKAQVEDKDLALWHNSQIAA